MLTKLLEIRGRFITLWIRACKTREAGPCESFSRRRCADENIACSGYRYYDKVIYDFTQTHLSGTRATDLGDVSLLPFPGNGKHGMGNGTSFDKAAEVAEPGCYAVTLDGGIRVEIAAAEHAAIYRIRSKERIAAGRWVVLGTVILL